MRLLASKSCCFDCMVRPAPAVVACTDCKCATVSIAVFAALLHSSALHRALVHRSAAKEKKSAISTKDKELLAKMRAMQEADFLRRLADKTKALLKERLDSEKASASVNRKKVENAWLKIMRMAKTSELRRDVEVLSQGHERDVDRKDALLQMLDADLEENEEQFATAVQEHLAHLDRLLSLQDARVGNLETAFEQQLAAVEEEYSGERAEMEASQAKSRREIKALIETVRLREENKAMEDRNDFIRDKGDLHSRSIERVTELTSQLEDVTHELEREFFGAHMGFLQHTDAKTEQFKNLTYADFKATRDYDRNMRHIRQLDRQLERWQSKMRANASDYTERNSSLKAERNSMNAHVMTLKQRLETARAAAGKRLQSVSKHAQEAKGELQSRLRLAERVLQLGERARSMQTDRERTTPFYTESLPVEDTPAALAGFQSVRDGSNKLRGSSPQVFAKRALGGTMTAAMTAEAARGIVQTITDSGGRVMTAAGGASPPGGGGARSDAAAQSARSAQLERQARSMTQTAAEEAEANAVGTAGVHGAEDGGTGDFPHMSQLLAAGEPQSLDNFWKQHNGTLLDFLTLDAERERLKDENSHLQGLLQQYLSGLTVDPDVMDGPNPLLITNGRTGAVVPSTAPGGRRRFEGGATVGDALEGALPVRIHLPAAKAPSTVVVEGNHVMAKAAAHRASRPGQR